jgi:superfamily II DNA or RNA helicase
MAPYARLAFGLFREAEASGASLSAFHEQLALVPGVKERRGLWEVPYNALEVVEHLRTLHPGVRVEAAAWGREPSERPDWEKVRDALAAVGEVQSWVLDGFLTHYQEDALTFGWNAAGVHYWHPTGSGKTLTGLICSLSVDGPVVVVTRAASRLQYGREIERFLNVRAYVIRPAAQTQGQIRVKGETWNQFRSRHKGQGLSTKKMGVLWKQHQAEHGIDPPKTVRDYIREIDHRPFIVVGWESLVDNINVLIDLQPGAVIFDESHRGKNSKRWDVVHLGELPEDHEEAMEQIEKDTREAKKKGGFLKSDEEGRKMFLPVENTASAASRLARASQKRICTTATPIKDRVRDLWAQLDLGEPNAWGNATAWKTRHCDLKPGIYGGMDDRGSSRLEELNLRLKNVAHILKYEETHRHLPAKRRQSMYIAPEDQCRPTGGFAKELRDAAKRGPMHVLEVKLAQAASKKRRAVLGLVEDHVSSNQKVVVFTGRKRDCDQLGEDVRKLTQVKAKGTTVWAAHGGQSTGRRQEIIDEYMAHPGPCVLVGTGHAFGESLNIHDTDAALFVMLPYTPGQLRQWEGRFTRLGQKRPVVIYYVIAEDTVDEHVASILIDKLPAVQNIAQDDELASAQGILSGIDENESEDAFVDSILADLDF